MGGEGIAGEMEGAGLRRGQRAPRQGFKSRQLGFISSAVIEQLFTQFSQETSKMSCLHSSVDIGLAKSLFAGISDPASNHGGLYRWKI